MYVGRKYRAKDIAGTYDVIVIGSGIGGLTAAALLAQAGRRVLVLERHYTAGGFTHSFTRRGYEWDVGVHYIGGVTATHTPIRKLFDALSENRLQWADMGAVYDRIDVGNGFVDFHAKPEPFKENLLKHFPRAHRDLDKYLKRIKSAEAQTAQVFGPRLLPGMLNNLAEPLSRLIGIGDYGKTTGEVMREITDDAKLAGILTGQWGDYGLPPSQASFGIHALVARHYLYGAGFPVGGASEIARTICPTIEKAGGQVIVRAEVEEILVKNAKAVGVRLAGGQEVFANHIVCATGIDVLTEKMLAPEIGAKLFPKRHTLTPSIGHLGLYIGLKGSAESLGLNSANLWLHASHDHDQNFHKYMADESAPFPFVYVSFPSSKDPNWNERFPNKTTIDVIAGARYDSFTQWADQPWRRRGNDYADYKETLAQRMLEPLLARLPHLRDKIDYYELSTPLSTETFCNYRHGELYGLDHNPARFRQAWLKPKTPIENLFLTGQDVMTCGVGGAMFGGVATFVAMAGLDALPVLRRTFA